MTDFLNLLGGVIGGPGRRIGRLEPEDNNGIGVSTVDSCDMGCETAILDNKGTYIVERYDSEEEAKKGHRRWVRRAKKGLKKITDIGYGDLTGKEEIELEPVK